MAPMLLGPDRSRLRVLCIGAHADDIEIGCGGTLRRWLQEYERVEVVWCVVCAEGSRGVEARQSADALLVGAASQTIVLGTFADAYLPADYRGVKDFIAALRVHGDADVVLSHRLEDRHQDHRLIAELTWQTWRNHLILEYEIPKYEGDLGQPNLYVPLTTEVAEAKVQHLSSHFPSQQSKGWYSADAFRGLMRLRGLECAADSGSAEAFTVRKMVF